MEDNNVKTIGAFILIIILVVALIIVSKGKHVEYKSKWWYEVSK